MKHNRKLLPLCRCARGFSLLEVLISVVILSIGLLGLAGLQASVLRNNHSAYLRSQATLLAYDIADRMRANRTTALDGNYNLAIDATPPTPSKDCAAVNCVATELATYDLNDWIQNITAALPAGDGEIIQPVSGTPSVVTVMVQWDDTRGEGDPKQFSMSTEL